MPHHEGLRAGPRQQQILALLARGMTDAQTAEKLQLSIATVRTYLSRLYSSNGFRNRTEAVASWLAWRPSPGHPEALGRPRFVARE